MCDKVQNVTTNLHLSQKIFPDRAKAVNETYLLAIVCIQWAHLREQKKYRPGSDDIVLSRKKSSSPSAICYLLMLMEWEDLVVGRAL